MNSSLKESTLDVLSQLNKESAQIGFSGLLELTGLVFFNTSELVNTKLPMQGPLINQRSLNYVMNSSLDLNLMVFLNYFQRLFNQWFSQHSTALCGFISQKTGTNPMSKNTSTFQIISTGEKSFVFPKPCSGSVHLFPNFIIFTSWNVRRRSQRICMFSTPWYSPRLESV